MKHQKQTDEDQAMTWHKNGIREMELMRMLEQQIRFEQLCTRQAVRTAGGG